MTTTKEEKLSQEVKKLSVGKVSDAKEAMHMWPKKTYKEGFMEGFRFARNNLQKGKIEILKALKDRI